MIHIDMIYLYLYTIVTFYGLMALLHCEGQTVHPTTIWWIQSIENKRNMIAMITTITIWLVVSIPLKNISQFGLLFPIYGKIKNVPNHLIAMYIVMNINFT